MLATLTAALLLGAPPAPDPATPGADILAPKQELFANEAWYKDQKGEEKDFTGVLKGAAPSPATVGVGRINPYRLTMTDDKDKQSEREVYVGAHPELLAAYVGHRIRLIGKAVDTEVEGKVHAEIWPAHLELLDAAPPPETPKEIPQTIDLLANNKTYLADATAEKAYVGVLHKKKGVDAVGYSLVIEEGDHVDRQDIHLFDQHYTLLDPYAGMRVKITGKYVQGTIAGVAASYILPGRLEVLPAGGDKPGKELKVLARATEWPFQAVAPVQAAIRDPKELALARGEAPDRATDEATQTRDADLTARQFKVETIDWTRQMILVAQAGAEPTGGYSVEITSLVVQDDVLTVHWRINAPKPGDVVPQMVTHPAQAVLTEHFDGKVVFEAEKAPTPPGK